MMLSAMWLTPLRGEGNQPFHLPRRGNVEVLADSIFSAAVLAESEQKLHSFCTEFVLSCGPSLRSYQDASHDFPLNAFSNKGVFGAPTTQRAYGGEMLD